MKRFLQELGAYALIIAIGLAILSFVFFVVMRIFVCPFYSFKTITEVPSICLIGNK